MKKLNKTRFAKRALEDFSRTMIELLSKKPFENIMVSEICEISNYPRATFYNYFEDKYGLLNYCWDCFGEKIDFQNDYDYMDTDEKMYDLFNSLYDFFEKNIEILRRITKQNNPNGEFMQIFKIYMKNQINIKIKGCSCVEKKKVPHEMLLEHYSNTVVLVLEWVFLKENILSKEDAKIYLKYLLEGGI